VFYGSNPYRKDNPRSGTSNASEAPQVPDAAFLLLQLPAIDYQWKQPDGGIGGRAAYAVDRVRGACGIGVAWLLGLPRRAGRRLHAIDDAEARWWAWEVSERRGGLVRRYRDTRFTALPGNPWLRRDELRDLGITDSAAPDCQRAGDH
jgi:hypothetical protein